MRRKDKALQNSDIVKILQHGEYGVLSTMDEGGQPYGVPLNYVYMNDCIYFHCALAGHKLENIAINSRVSFCVVGDTCLLPEEFSTEFESVILFGTAAIVQGEERYQALMGLVHKYSPQYAEEGKVYIEEFDSRTAVVRVSVESVTGKASRKS